MNIIEPDSSFSIQMDFSLSETDFSVLSFLYLPIIKSDAYLLYEIFYRLNPMVSLEGQMLHDDFFTQTGFDSVRFLKAREKLEAIGLLETYRKETSFSSGSKILYVYRVIPIASPKKFFSDPILKNLLLQSVSNKKYHRLVNYFKKDDEKKLDGYDPVTARFNDVYSVNLSEEDLGKENNIEEKRYKEIAEFSSSVLFDYLKADNLPVEKLKPYLSQIEDDAKLYGLDEKTALKLVEESFDTEFNFYLNQFESKARKQNRYVRDERENKEKASIGKGDASKTVQIFTSTTPKQYLQAFFHAEPSDYMLKEVEDLRRRFGFDNGVINVILDYCLKKTGKEFNSMLIDKVASTLSANEVDDCYSAIVQLKTRDFKAGENKKKKNSAPKTNKETSNIDDAEDEKEEVTKEDLLKLSEGLGL